MPRIAVIAADTADSSTSAALAAVAAKLGRVPNLFATFARAPAVLQAYLAFADALGKGRLSVRQREIIALATAQANRCAYCLAAHSAIAASIGMDEESLVRARHGGFAKPEEQALVELSLALVEQRGALSDAQLATARAAGLSDEQLLEVVANVSLNLLTNYSNLVADTEVDFPAVAVAA